MLYQHQISTAYIGHLYYVALKHRPYICAGVTFYINARTFAFNTLVVINPKALGNKPIGYRPWQTARGCLKSRSKALPIRAWRSTPRYYLSFY